MLLKIYEKLLNHFGPQRWWPVTDGKNPKFEIILGAILTQQTTWKNVEKSIKILRQKNLLTPEAILSLSHQELEILIKSSGFFRLKSKRLKNFIVHLFENYNGNLEEMFKNPLEKLRNELLSINGIGPETCDSILLYAREKPVFVVDAYTMRLCKRFPLIESKNYEKVRSFFETNLPKKVDLFKEFHALIVELGKNYCKVKPICESCPLKMNCSKN